MNIFSTIRRLFVADVAAPRELDFVPVGNADCRTPEKIAEARKKLGRPFSPEVKAERVTPASYQLEHINELTEHAKARATVTRLDDRKRTK